LLNEKHITPIVLIILIIMLKKIVLSEVFSLILQQPRAFTRRWLGIPKLDVVTMERKTLQRKPSKIARGSDKAVQRQFTMLPSDTELIEKLRRKYQREALKRKKETPADIARSEVIRAGIHSLTKMSGEDLFSTIEAIEELKVGRPKKQSA
jgi:hypothetical protein